MDFFDNYAKNYDLTNEHMGYKYYHSIRVMNNMITLAKNLSLSPEDIELARCIGILHDIGRFDQYMKYQSFKDDKMDHGDYACELIDKLDILKHYNISTNDYQVVKTAIRNHNKIAIEPNITRRELLFSKMIRDADKLDILYSLGTEKLKNIVEEDDGEISSLVSKSFLNEENVSYDIVTNLNEKLVLMFSYIYDINYPITLSIIKEYDYYGKIYNRLKHKELFKPFINKINDYLKERTD